MTKITKISDRADGIEKSITLAITELAYELSKENKPVISFSAGEPNFSTPEKIKQAGINAINGNKTRYTAATGTIELKEAVAAKLKRDNGLDYGAADIVVANGAKQAICNTLMAIINPGDEVIIPAPYWVSYPSQIKIAGGTPVVMDTDETTCFKITADQLKKVITDKTRALFLTTPSNPTGAVYDEEELAKIAEVCVDKGIYVISDEIYEKLTYGGKRHVSIAGISEEVKNLTIVINGVSKAYAMTGWRIGYSASKPEIAKAIGKIQSHFTSNPSTPSQWASIEALNGDETEIEKMRVAFDERRLYMAEAVNNIKGISCFVPDGAFYVFPNISRLTGKKSRSGIINNSADFCKFLLNEKYVACIPGSGFGLEGYIRLSYATSMENIKKGIDLLKEWVENLK
ncbi:MAG: pyridoxal phosphate-dependent aminotransferase [bacterium]|nr:pyridoxal phosphate-dependent aminotransferase [bacterium]